MSGRIYSQGCSHSQNCTQLAGSPDKRVSYYMDVIRTKTSTAQNLCRYVGKSVYACKSTSLHCIQNITFAKPQFSIFYIPLREGTFKVHLHSDTCVHIILYELDITAGISLSSPIPLAWQKVHEMAFGILLICKC